MTVEKGTGHETRADNKMDEKERETSGDEKRYY